MLSRRIKNENRRVVVAMSGGVDSSVSAALLKKDGFDVAGVFMKCWSEEEFRTGVCTTEEDERWARRAAAKIGIPFYSVDLVKEYRKKVVDYFLAEYGAGRTPNPDVMCNKEIKFGMFYDMAMKQFGADFVATGHYARIDDGKLLKGKDPDKDQSYFLWAVDRDKLRNILFPIGGYRKKKVREMARDFGLPNAERKDSQGICFIGKVNVGNFLEAFIANSPGAIVNTKGEEIGEHPGLHFYTIGQRRGINIGGGPPYYVAEKRHRNNTLVVAREYDDELLRGTLTAEAVNWIGERPAFPAKVTAKIRYRQPDQRALLSLRGESLMPTADLPKGSAGGRQKENKNGSIEVVFDTPQRAVTSGQSVVFYQGDELVGGGVIK